MANTDTHDSILVLDFGSQYNQLISRRIRELGVYSELKPHSITAAEIKELKPKGLIFSGGPNSVYADGAFSIDPEIFNLNIPILGVCYGMQLMAHMLPGGKVQPASGTSEYGETVLKVTDEHSTLFAETPAEQTVLMSHGDSVSAVPDGFTAVATSDSTPIAAMENPERQLYGVQFHAEVRHTVYGMKILENFIDHAVHANRDWSMDDFIDEQIAKIRETVGDKRVLLGLSGGVDSSVVGVLLHKAIGNQLTSIFVDHGLLRKNEADEVMDALGGKFGLNIIKVDAQERFLNKLAGVTDPEQKRKIIGNEFIRVFDEEAVKLDGIDFWHKVRYILTLLSLVLIQHKQSSLITMLVDYQKTFNSID